MQQIIWSEILNVPFRWKLVSTTILISFNIIIIKTDIIKFNIELIVPKNPTFWRSRSARPRKCGISHLVRGPNHVSHNPNTRISPHYQVRSPSIVLTTPTPSYKRFHWNPLTGLAPSPSISWSVKATQSTPSCHIVSDGNVGFGLQSLTLGPDTETVVLSLFVASQTHWYFLGWKNKEGMMTLGRL